MEYFKGATSNSGFASVSQNTELSKLFINLKQHYSFSGRLKRDWNFEISLKNKVGEMVDCGTLTAPKVDLLLVASKGSSFGKGPETVYDESVRKGNEITADQLTHRDTVHTANHKMTLLVEVNSKHLGGDLILSRNGEEIRWRMGCGKPVIEMEMFPTYNFPTKATTNKKKYHMDDEEIIRTRMVLQYDVMIPPPSSLKKRKFDQLDEYWLQEAERDIFQSYQISEKNQSRNLSIFDGFLQSPEGFAIGLAPILLRTSCSKDEYYGDFSTRFKILPPFKVYERSPVDRTISISICREVPPDTIAYYQTGSNLVEMVDNIPHLAYAGNESQHGMNEYRSVAFVVFEKKTKANATRKQKRHQKKRGRS